VLGNKDTLLNFEGDEFEKLINQDISRQLRKSRDARNNSQQIDHVQQKAEFMTEFEKKRLRMMSQ
jgi:hypothetical protein